MKNLLKSDLLKNYLILLLFTSAIEISFRIISGITLIDYSLIRIFLGLNFISLLLSFLYSWLNKKLRTTLMIITCLIFTIYAFFQMGFNNFIGVYASVNSSSQLGAVVDYIKDFFGSFLGKYYYIFIPFAVLIIYYIFFDRKLVLKETKKFVLNGKKERTIITTLSLAIFAINYYLTLTIPIMQNDLQTISNKELFKYPSVSSIVVNQFGVLGYGILDIKSYNKEAPEAPVVATSNNKEEITDRVIDDTLWDEVIANEKNQTLNQINNQLINNGIPGYNDHTGLLEGKNLIVIMMESVNEIFINEELYPNFYKLYTEGISFKNHYSPRNSCATGNNEFSGMTGLYSIQNNCTANKYKNNKYFSSIFNLFNDAGYKTSSMHNYTEAYYFRRSIHKNLGSNAYYGVQDLGIKYYNEYVNWSSDEDFMNAAMDITLSDNSKPFMLWLTTVSSHQPYNTKSVEGDKYLSITEDTNYPMDLRRYMSKLKTLDNALGILLERLETAGILDDTVIALYGDHYPYGLKKNVINKILTRDLSEYEIERTPLTIYNSTITPEVVEKYTSYVNLTPTIANLFNLNYDPRYYMGEDVFNEDYLNAVVFADGSWKNDIAYYDASKAKIKYYEDETLSVEEIKRINSIVTSRRKMSASIIKNNYFDYLDKELKELETEKNTLANIGG